MKGSILKELRKNRKITQEELAKKLNVSKSTIGMIESGKQLGGRNFTRKAADFFNVSIDYLEGRIDEKSKNNKSLVKDLLIHLYNSEIIKSTKDIDEAIEGMIINMAKKELELIINEGNRY